MARHRTAVTTRFDTIQALRFVAALLVVITHATLYTHERLDDSLAVWHFGEVGVNVFFTISGFVMIVSTRALAGDRDGWKYFAMRRAIRIVPIYWLATTLNLLALLAIPGAVLHSKLEPSSVVLSYLFLPSTNSDGRVEPLLGVGWTLTFEVFFYALFALALYLRRSPLTLCGGVLIVLSVGSIARDGDWPAATVYFNPIVLYFLIGMVIASYALDRQVKHCALRLAGILLLFTAVRLATAASNDDLDVWRDLGQHFAVTGVLLAAVTLEPALSGRLPRPVLYLGDASYSLYLFHPMIAPLVPVVLNKVGIRVPALSVVLCVVAAIIGSVVIYRFVEGPSVRWLQNRLPYVRRTAPASADVAP